MYGLVNGQAINGATSVAAGPSPEIVFETAELGDATFSSSGALLAETLQADDYLVANKYYVERETALLNDALYSSVTRAADLAETAELADVAIGVLRVSALLSEAAVVSGNAVVPSPNVTINDTAALASVTYARGVRTTNITEQADVGDLTYVGDTALLVDSADLSDSLVVRVRAQQIETALVTSTAYLGNAVTVDAVDAAQLGSQTFLASTLRAHHVDVLFVFDDVLEVPDGVAWTANLGNWAMSRYTGFTFNSVVDGFAASEDGVYVPGAGSVAAKFDSGRARMSPGTKARLEYVYTDVETSAPMDVIVTGDTSAGKVTHSYAQVARDLTNTKAAKAKVGKGFNSSYYSVAHSSASPFVVQKAELLFADSARRI